MNIVRFRRSGGAPEVGVVSDGLVRSIPGVEALAQLWHLGAAELRDRLTSLPHAEGSTSIEEVTLLAPVDGRTEIWACGVTYETSREARIEESDQAADVYALVYDAQRPELFFKSVAWRASGPGASIGVRVDSTVDVPEPELAAVVNRLGEIVGWTVCNDVSSRSIEGENPLYLPQAKMFSGACGLGPWVTPWWEVEDPYQLAIHLRIERSGETAWTGEANTSSLHRRIDDLVGYLFRGDIHPDGAVLSTGTCLVPAAPFSLQDGDVVTVEVTGVGSLTNPVVRGFVNQEAS